MPETQLLFLAGFQNSKPGVARIASGVAAGARRYFTARDLCSNIIFRYVVVQRRVRVIQHPQQIRLFGALTFKQQIE